MNSVKIIIQYRAHPDLTLNCTEVDVGMWEGKLMAGEVVIATYAANDLGTLVNQVAELAGVQDDEE